MRAASPERVRAVQRFRIAGPDSAPSPAADNLVRRKRWKTKKCAREGL